VAKYKKLGIIDRLKIWIRGKFMEKKNFLVVVDGTDARTRVSINRGILNTFVVRALDPIHAKKIILNMFAKGIADQLADALYVYEMDQIATNIKALDEQNKLPIFSYMPLDGRRPPKQNDVQITTLGNKTLTPNTSNAGSNTTIPNTRVPVTGMRGGRSQEFHQTEESRPNTTNRLTPEQAALVASLGVVPSRTDTDEGVNLRVNSATGVNHNLTGTTGASPLNPDQAELLRQLNVEIPQQVSDPELQREIEESGITSLVDDSLTQIEEKPLGEDDLKRLASE
jgi:hypothetical protein